MFYHSVFWQYPPERTRKVILDTIETAGAAATKDAPFVWLRMEPRMEDLSGPMEVRLTSWPGGKDRLLARVHPHGER